MLLKKNATEKKLNGRYYTNKNLAKYIIEWIISGKNIDLKRILEPSCGDGVFLECVAELGIKENCEIVAIEIDKIESKIANEKIEKSKFYENYKEYQVYRKNNLENYTRGELSIINDDFYNAYQQGLDKCKFQGIMGNPPYIRYQYLTQNQREEQSLILNINGMKSNKLINAWVSFVVACIQMMDSDSRIGLVIPAELLQVKYAEDLRKFLMKSLQKMTIVTFEQLIFEDVEQEVVLLLGEKDSNYNTTHQLRIAQYKNIENLVEVNDLEKYEFFNVNLNETKWTKYFLNDRSIHLIDEIRKDKKFKEFREMAKIEVGITTGNNDYFCVNKSQVEEFDLQKICRPLIARSVNINGIVFTKQDWNQNIEKGAKTYLIDFPDIPLREYSEGQKKYIRNGEKNKQNVGYKCNIRKRWYRVPSIRVSDAFFLRRNYLYPKFMLNSDEVNAVSTDTMHRVTFNNKRESKRILLSYYNSVGLAFTEIEGRSYGGGVLEILPREVGRIILPDLRDERIISDKVVDDLINLIDNHIRNNIDILEILDEIDKKILVDIIGMDLVDVLEFRGIWVSLRDRRLNRGKK